MTFSSMPTFPSDRCLPSETLLDMVEGILPPHVAGDVEAHVSQCSRCNRIAEDQRHLVRTLFDLGRNFPLPPEREVEAVLRAFEDSAPARRHARVPPLQPPEVEAVVWMRRVPLVDPASLGFRGDNITEMHVFEAEAIGIRLITKREDSGELEVNGQAYRVGSGQNIPVQEVEFQDPETGHLDAVVNDSGGFVVKGLYPGRWDVTIRVETLVLRIAGMDLDHPYFRPVRQKSLEPETIDRDRDVASDLKDWRKPGR